MSLRGRHRDRQGGKSLVIPAMQYRGVDQLSMQIPVQRDVISGVLQLNVSEKGTLFITGRFHFLPTLKVCCSGIILDSYINIMVCFLLWEFLELGESKINCHQKEGD